MQSVSDGVGFIQQQFLVDPDGVLQINLICFLNRTNSSPVLALPDGLH
jgi:hypothetical protein